MNIVELKSLEHGSKLFYKLWEMTHPGGDLQLLFGGQYKFIHAFLLLNEHKTLYGWSCIYKTDFEQYKIGVYVKKHYRHQGYGKTLLYKCFEHCKKNYVSCNWYDRKIEEWKYFVAPFKMVNGEIV